MNVPRTPELQQRQIASLDSIHEDEKANEKSIVRKYSPPKLTNTPLSLPIKLPTIEIKPRTEKQVPIKPIPPTKRVSISEVNLQSTDSKQPELLTTSLPIDDNNKVPIQLPVPYHKPRLTEQKLNHVVNEKIQEIDKPDINTNERPPILMPIQPRIMVRLLIIFVLTFYNF